MKECSHQALECLNPYELIRKYECGSCGEVMMCECDRDIGEKFLLHQLKRGVRLGTQERVPVTLGFVVGACDVCRTGKPSPHTVAPHSGRTSKLKRYYWRELAFRTMALYEQLGGTPEQYVNRIAGEPDQLYLTAQSRALTEIRELHKISPMYDYKEESSADVIQRLQVPMRHVAAEYVKSEGRKALVRSGLHVLPVEEFAKSLYEERGYTVLHLESRPFHVIFGTLAWPLIQDPDDPLLRVVQFGEREGYERDGSKLLVSTSLPSDFGTPGYSERRAAAFDPHFSELAQHTEDLSWLIDSWLEPSWGLRQYLWAHREGDVKRARSVVQILPSETTIKIVRYLAEAYWDRYLGWPDLLAHRADGVLFVEVKSSSDSLSHHQKRWLDFPGYCGHSRAMIRA